MNKLENYTHTEYFEEWCTYVHTFAYILEVVAG